MRYMINTYGNVDLGTLDWNISGSNFYAYEISNKIKKPKDDNTIANIYCNLYRAVPLNASFVEGDMAVGVHGYLYIRDTRYTTTAEFKEAMIGQILRYELETPANGGYLPMYKGRYKVSDVCQLFIPDDTHTVAGVTITNNGDGSLTIDGTGTGSGSYTNFTTLGKNNMPYKIGDKLFVSAYVISGTCSFLYGGFSQSGNPIITITNASEGTYYFGDISTKNEYEIRDYLGFYVGNNTFNNFRVKFNIINLTEMYGAGNEPTTVEQFRADYPNELYEYSPYCWTSMKTMRYLEKTKNLFDYTKVNGLEHTSTGNPYSNYLKINGESFGVMAGLYDRGVNFIPHFILDAGTYTMSLIAKGTSPGDEGQFGIIKFNGDGTKPSFTKQWVTSDSRQSYTFTLDENSEIAIRVQGYGNASNAKNLDSTFSNIQLEEGSTATEYHPYGYLPLK